MSRRLIDISPPIDERLAVWPGDTAPSREVLFDLERGDAITLSTLHATVHLGAHADAPSHYGRGAPSIEAAALERYVGPCRVVRVDVARGGAVGPGELPGPHDDPRLLIATGTAPDATRFDDGFASLAPELIERVAAAGVRLIGVDTPSVDRATSKRLPTHAACLRHDVSIVEGLALGGVPAGRYELIALPLRLVGFDASPVRAVLRPLDDD